MTGLANEVAAAHRLLEGLCTERGLASIPRLGARRPTVDRCAEVFRWYFRPQNARRSLDHKGLKFAALRDALASGADEVATVGIAGKKSMAPSSVFGVGESRSAVAAKLPFPRPCHGNAFRRGLTNDSTQPPAVKPPAGCLLDNASDAPPHIDADAHALLLSGAAAHAARVLCQAAIYACYSMPALVEGMCSLPERRQTAAAAVRPLTDLNHFTGVGAFLGGSVTSRFLTEQLRLKALVSRDAIQASSLALAATAVSSGERLTLPTSLSAAGPTRREWEAMRLRGLDATCAHGIRGLRALVLAAARRCGQTHREVEEGAEADTLEVTVETPIAVSTEHIAAAIGNL